ncbi:MAG TPA: hypothetical protein VF042_05750 [Gemmatimonadaceae bacterium]
MLLQATGTPAPPAPPSAPVIAGGGTKIVVDGAPIAASAHDVYLAFRAQRRELGNQMEGLTSQREDLSRELQSETVTGADRKGLEQRITTVDERIASLEKQIAEADAQVAKAAAVPGAAVDPPEPPRTGPPDEAYVVAVIFMFVFLLPMSIAFARRIWKKTPQIVSNIPRELSERLMRVEQTVEASALEIERIGEGQRFMTRLFTEAQSPHALPSSQTAMPTSRPGDIRP